MTEEARAAAYRARARARAAAERSRRAALAGNADAARAVRDAWEPLVEARLEARSP